MTTESQSTPHDKATSEVHIGDVDSGIHDSTIAGRDVDTGDRHIQIGHDARDNVTISGKGNIVIIQATRLVAESEPADEIEFGPNPYLGLCAFQEEDANRFFGRETLIQELWEKFRKLHDLQPSALLPLRLLTILGPSGSGKSSLARAGLIPELAHRPLPGLRTPRVAVITPGVHPLEALAGILARIATQDLTPAAKAREFTGELKQTNESNEYDGLRRIAGVLTDITTFPLIILVDQFEELYTLCKDTHEQEIFVDNLLHAAADRAAHVSILLTLRSDFLGQTQRHPDLNHAIAQQGVIVPAMNEEELRRAIAEPARRAGHPIDEATVNLLVSETEGREGALPLLQFALTRIWEGMADDVEPAETLRNIGGVGGALAREAQRLYKNLSETDKPIARRAFLGLVQLGEGAQDTRRRIQVEDIVAHSENPEYVREVLRVFSRRDVRLITMSADLDGIDTAEITHEALLEHWNLLKEWLQERRSDLRFQRRFQMAATYWREQGHPRGLLWRSPDLDLLRNFHERFRSDMTTLEVEFFKASQMAQRRSTYIQWGVAAAIGVLLIAVLVIYAVSQSRIASEQAVARATAEFLGTKEADARQTAEDEVVQRETAVAIAVTKEAEAQAAATTEAEQRQAAESAQAEAQKQTNLALSRLLTIQSDNQLNANNNQLALLLAVEAGNIADTPEAVDALYTALPRIRQSLRNFGPVVNAGWNRDGTHLITIGVNGITSVWDWNKAEPERLNLSGHKGPITQVVWNPDGTHILTTSMDGAARIWQIEPDPTEHGNDIGHGPLILRHPGPVIGATWNSDSTRILTTWCQGIMPPNVCQRAISQVWDAQTGAELASFPHPGSGLPVPPLFGTDLLATWNVKGTYILVTGCVEGLMPPDHCDNVVVEIWDVKTEEHFASLIGHSSWVNHAVWNRDGTRILTASDDGSVRVWDTETGNQLAPSMDHEFKVEKATWNADETRVHTSTRGGTAHIWDVKSGFEMRRFQADKMVWSSHGTRILAASRDGSLRVLDAETQAELITLLGHKGQVAQVAWNAEDTRLFTLGFDGTVRLWDAESTTELPTLFGHTEGVERAVWNADGSRILTASADATARVWDANTGVTLLSLTGHSDGVTRAIWNSHETRILTASRDGTARIWDAKTGDNVLTLFGHTDWVEQAVWNANETLVLTASRDGTARVWKAETGDELARLPHPKPIREAAWNADGTRILTLSLDNTARIWKVETERKTSVLAEWSGISQVVWSPDGTRILTISSEDDQSVQVRDGENGVELVNLAGHLEKVNQAVWNIDGTHILTASEDGTAKVWDAQTGEEILSLNHGDGIDQAAWNADETLIFTRGFSQVKIWDVKTSTNLVTLSRHSGITHVTWNGNGSRFLVTDQSGSVRQHFAPRTDVLVERACQVASRNLSVDEWRRFMEDNPYRATCLSLPIEKNRISSESAYWGNHNGDEQIAYKIG